MDSEATLYGSVVRIHSVTHWSRPIKGTPRVSPNVNYGLWGVLMSVCVHQLYHTHHPDASLLIMGDTVPVGGGAGGVRETLASSDHFPSPFFHTVQLVGS